MKMDQNLKEANIQNLTSLWEMAARPFGALVKSPKLNYCLIENSDWPNRLWFNERFTGEAVKLAVEKVTSASQKLLVPFWDINGHNSSELLEEQGFKVLFEQVAMALKPEQPFSLQNSLTYKLVSCETDAKLWAEIYPLAFGYKIGQEVLMKTGKEISYYLFYYQNKAAGTAILYHKDGVSGIHGVGVIPEMRRKGLAEEIMRILLNKSIEMKAEYATLQASAMGKTLYLKLGFEEQFLIRNYVWQEGK